MSAALSAAKSIANDVAGETVVRVRLQLLQALIAEIEQLEAAVPAGSVKLVRELASQRAVDQHKGPL